ncbi:hypothetical protein OIE68_13405 [Nocardia vinacea]|uniref:Nucleotide exchange factor GrpE n=1 Tax=Nocardia vinacea TaxID=96468 RepID=A0ABZ1YX90_9NOCA|nr:hypothetical protein OIE68_13405 [Nocardia vinacea]
MIPDSVVSAARRLVAVLHARLNPPAPEPEHRCGVLTPDVVAAIATAQWRANRRLDETELRPLRRQIRTTLEHLAEAGVDVQDHGGAEFVAGQRLEVVAAQEMPGIDRATVVETLRPSVYLRGVLIQTGEVIVGMPVGGTS